ncbi:membrane-flanked domain protein [Aeromicrobium sp. Root495]|uniref:PH domain-containing protein n=1 Tax=Aeromicrobium sp. Root495 TaxID=1736550 RepID=UPI0007012869|nr:PH domain-containing protein [Aeromicrobium sp. Root495]KQY59669.1 membrane-flanked domain protein [Aeromicrobium sp. Root495]
MIRALLDRLPEQEVESHLLSEEGEEVIDLVRHHWIVYWLPALELVGVALLWLLALLGPIQLGWFFLVGGAVLALHAVYTIAGEHRDVFVITNMRVFRASGVFSVRIATMPITRILDITVEKPFLGRVLGYGHFVFESAAQAQGLRDIRYIGDPDQRDLTIQRVVQRSGLRTRSTVDRQMLDGH